MGLTISFFTPNRIFFLSGTLLVPLLGYFCASRFRPESFRRREWLYLAGFAAALTIILTYPISLHPSDHVVGIFDSRPLAYVQAWDVHSLKHPWRLFDANIFFPAHNTLAYSENLLGNLLVFAPLYWASNNPILGYNLVTLTTFFVSFLTMYWLVKRMTGKMAPAVVAAFVYAFVPARIFQMERFHVISEQWTPLVVLFAWSYLELGGAVPLIAFAGFLYLEVLTSLHGGIFTLMITSLYVATFVVLGRTRGWQRIGYVAATGVLVGIALLPVAVHYFQGQQMAANSDYIDPVAVSANLSSYLNGGENHFYHRFLLRFQAPLWNHEKRLFFGLLPWVLAAIGVVAFGIGSVRARLGQAKEFDCRLHTLTLASTLTLAVGFFLSLGPYLQWGNHVSGIPLPYLWLAKFLPGFRMMRVPTRFAFVGLFGVAILAGLGFEALLHVLEQRSTHLFRAKAAALAATLLWFMAWESCQAPLSFEYLGSALEGHGEYRWLAAQPAGSAIVELPTTSGDLRLRSFSQVLQEIDYMYASTYHWQPLISGISSHYPPIFYETTSWAVKLPDPEAALALRRIGVRFVVVHSDLLRPQERARWQQLPADSELTQAAAIDRAIIYRLEPKLETETR